MAPPPLHAELIAHLEAYRAARAFCPQRWIDEKTVKLNDYMRRCGLKACVVSCSGGIDSAVVLFLCQYAKEKGYSKVVSNASSSSADSSAGPSSALPGVTAETPSSIEKVVGVCQPIHSSQWSLDRGLETIRACKGAKEVVVDQSAIHTQLQSIVDTAVGLGTGGSFASGQLRSYMRTPVGYYVAQLCGQNGTPAIVMGTGNMDEDGYLAYFCKAGDGVVDVQLISDLHKSEVFAVARAIGVPSSTVEAPPSADLWEGQTDEDELGFSYDFVELLTEIGRAHV